VNNEVNKVLFIVNQHAGRGYQSALEGRIIDACEERDLECVIEYTQSRGHATELAKRAVEENVYRNVVAVGGDGTVNEVAKGLLHSKIPMAIIPNGSGNGLARHLCIPMDIPGAINHFFESKEIAMDTFLLNGKLSLNVSGIGFDGHIANLFGKEKKRGLQGYIKHSLNEFFRFTEFEAEIKTATQTITRKAFVIAIANSSQYGNNARIAPAASVCDQLLHVNILKKVPPYRIDFMYNFFVGKVHRSSFCEWIETDQLDIRLNQPMAFHVDGEPSGNATEFSVRLIPSSLKMMVHPDTTRP
jgi:YegS/Rv2252/BmrU family lipid kinase